MSPVTDHAVVRYLERIHGLDLTGRYSTWTDRRRAEAGCATLGITIAEARDLVCPPRLHAAVRIGSGRIIAADRRLVLANGAVVTCMEPAIKPSRRRRHRSAA